MAKMKPILRVLLKEDISLFNSIINNIQESSSFDKIKLKYQKWIEKAESLKGKSETEIKKYKKECLHPKSARVSLDREGYNWFCSKCGYIKKSED